jgi:porphobilinogen synthase
VASSPKDKTVSLRTERAKRSGSKTRRAARGSYPTTRLRRNRRADWSRRLICENALNTDDLIWPIFVIEGERKRTPVAAMPGVERLSVDLAVKAAEEAAALGIPAIALFPNTEPSLRDELASEALNPANPSAARCAPSKRGTGHRHYLRRRARPIPATAMMAHRHGEIDNDRTV